MFPSALITFRETIEAALVIGIILSILSKTNQTALNKYVWRGVLAGVGASLLLALAIELFFGALPESIEAVFEGILMFITASFITWMIMWIHRQKDTIKNLKTRLKNHIDNGYAVGIVILTSTAILREGVETVLYLKAGTLIGLSDQLSGGLIGIIIALILSFILFRLSVKIDLKQIFNITSVFLIMFAAGLISHGIHEFQEIGIMPIFSFDPIYNITHIIDHKSAFGGILRALFGFTSRPTFLEISSYVLYIGVILKIISTKKSGFQKA